MRKVIDLQMRLGEQSIGDIVLDTKSRDDIPKLLRGLQFIYMTPAVRSVVFSILEEILPVRKVGGSKKKVDPNTGRPGMTQWTILVLGVLRLGLNEDYDRIHELANQHKTVRQMLGHDDWIDETKYELQTIKDNLKLFTPEILDRINQEVVRAGHTVLKKSLEDDIVGRCDSFVVETNVHFPTDINLLQDAIRKTMDVCVKLSDLNGLDGWRNHSYHQRQFKKQYRIVQRLKHSTSKDEDKRQQKQAEIKDSHRVYLDQARIHLTRAEQTRKKSPRDCLETTILLQNLDMYMDHARRQIDQIDQRVLREELIPHKEKVFSIFEPHTDWISKGKAGVPVELGLRVCIVEDEDRFILHHKVMEKCTDDQVAVPIVDETKKRFPELCAISMDKGFHSPKNQIELKERLECVVLPKKGRLSQKDKEREFEPEFSRLRRQHSAVESAINALEVHGLDKCLDHGIDGFKRYVALAVVARNIHRLGAILRQQDRDKELRKRGPYNKKAA
ncbi:MAG TPA: ISNCY family transposase [Magnetococcales bacterium]|nr:ISNCY family transposase [Magnetococcales bacterium]